MVKYISTIIYVCIFSIILELILPDNGLKKYIGVVISLVVILILISPICNVIDSDNVIATVSKQIDEIKANIKSTNNEYDFENYKDKVVLNSVKYNLEEELENYLKDKYKDFTKVKIELNEKYEIEKVKIYVKNLEEIYEAKEIINDVVNKYNIQDYLIEVTKENKNGEN